MADREKHEVACNKFRKSRDIFEREEEKLRATPGDGFMQPDDVFGTSAGHFWDIPGTRNYMAARYAFVIATLKVNTVDAVKSALGHTMELVRLNRSDKMRVRDLVPTLLLRLGRDQECYDFVKWYATVGQSRHYDPGDLSFPFLSVTRADVFERVDYICETLPNLSHVVAATLLKIRLLLSLTALKNQSIVVADFPAPAEIHHNVTLRLPESTIVANDQEILNRTSHATQIEQLAWQVRRLYQHVRKANKHFWPGLLQPDIHLEARSQVYSQGSVAEMQLVLQYSIEAWRETPGALEVIEGPTSG